MESCVLLRFFIVMLQHMFRTVRKIRKASPYSTMKIEHRRCQKDSSVLSAKIGHGC